jgi:hypothetical protein
MEKMFGRRVVLLIASMPQSGGFSWRAEWMTIGRMPPQRPGGKG